MNKNILLFAYALSLITLTILLLGFANAKSDDVNIMGGVVADIAYPVSGDSFDYSAGYFNWSLSYNSSQLINCSYILNGVSNDFSCALRQVPVIFPEGNNSLSTRIQIQDNSTAFSQVSFFQDSLPPQISITSPSNTSYGDSITSLEYTLIEANPNSCWFSNNGGLTNYTLSPCTAGNNTFNFNSSENTNTWTVWANDSLGHVNSSSVTFWVDSIYPLISFNAETMSSGNYSQDWIYAGISASDANAIVTSINLYDESNVLINSSSSSSFNFTGLPDGIYYLNATVNDTWHITLTETRIFVLDSHAPAVSLILPANNHAFDIGTTDAILEFNVSDFSEISSCSLTINSLANQSSSSIVKNTNLNFTLSGLSSGEYSWAVSCTENFEAFNKIGSSSTFSFTILSALTFPAGTNYTNLSEASDITSTSFFVSNSFGIINWINALDLSRGLDWALYINLSESRVDVNSALAPELNQPAAITLYNINLTNPEVLRDGSPCGAYCTGQAYDNYTLTLAFNVTGFSVYTVREYEAPKSSGSYGGSGGGSNCKTNWTCTNWTSCLDNHQTRICTKLKDWCYADAKPLEFQACTIIPEILPETPVPQAEEIQEEIKEPEIQVESQGRNWLGLTGAVIGANAVPFVGALAFIIIIVGVYLFFKIRQEKESKRIKKFLAEVKKMSPKW